MASEGRNGPWMGISLEDVMERQKFEKINEGEKSGGGKSYRLAVASAFKLISYEKIVLLKMLLIIFIGLLSLLLFGTRQQ